MRRFVPAALLWLICLAAACSGKGSIPVQPDSETAAPFSGLPSPAEISRGLSNFSPEDYVRVCAGGTFIPFGTTNHVLQTNDLTACEWISGPDGVFSPVDSGNDGTLADCAYAPYGFYGQQSFSGPNKLHLQWKVSPDKDNVYVGLADIDDNVWRWYRPGADDIANLPDGLSTNIKPGLEALIFMVLVTGEQAGTLDAVVLGDPLVPDVLLYSDLSSNKAQNIAPRLVTFNATVAVAGSTVETFEFDLDGQPGYEIQVAPEVKPQFEYSNPGDYTVNFRSVDSNGAESTRSLAFTIVDPNNTPPTADFSATPENGGGPLPVILDASASNDNGSIIKYEWDIDGNGDYDFDTGSEPTLNYTFGIQGINAVVLRVTDNDFATSTKQRLVTLSSGWKRRVISNGATVYDGLTMAVSGVGSNARACVAWHDDALGALCYANATAEDGSSWDVLQILEMAPGYDCGLDPSMCILPGGPPAIAYGKKPDISADCELRYIRALDLAGNTWTSATSLTSLDDKIGTGNSMTLIDGFPAVASLAYGGYEVQSHIVYLRANDIQGDAWGSPQTAVLNEGANVNHPAMFAGELGPIIAYGTGQKLSAPARLHTKRATSFAGTDWTNEYIWDDYYVGSTSFTYSTGGLPLLAVGGSGASPQLLSLRGALDGMNWAPFPTELTPAAPLSGGWASAANLNGTPAIAFYSMDSNDLYYMQSSNGAGTAWGPPIPVWTAGDAGDGCAMVSVNGVPVICYYDDTVNAICAAYYQY